MGDFRITVSNKILVENPTSDVIKYCRENLMVRNPDYYKKVSMGKWTGNTPENIVLFERVGDNVVLPFGCLGDLWRDYKDAEWVRDIADLRHFNYQSGINLYPYQEKAVNEAISARNGVIVMPCGAGKTQTGLELASRIGGRTLWLTHTQDLLNQSMNRARSVFDAPLGSYGKITAGKVSIGDGLTFATVQTMSKLDLSQLKYTFDCVVVDECHKAVGSPTKVMQFYKVLSGLSCRFKYGLTATPKRADGLEKSMFALLGGICTQVDRSAVADTTCPVKVERIDTDYFPSMDIVLAGDGTLNYAALVDDLTHDRERMELVGDKVEECAKDGATLVLANRVEYLKTLREYVDTVRSVCLSGAGNSKAAKAERKEALRKFNNGELDCVFATYQLAAEGLDIPNLRYVVLATPEKDPTRIKQTCGRVERRAEGKTHGTVIDIIDPFGMYLGWAKKRKSLYDKLGYDII